MINPSLVLVLANLGRGARRNLKAEFPPVGTTTASIARTVLVARLGTGADTCVQVPVS